MFGSRYIGPLFCSLYFCVIYRTPHVFILMMIMKIRHTHTHTRAFRGTRSTLDVVFCRKTKHRDLDRVQGYNFRFRYRNAFERCFKQITLLLSYCLFIIICNVSFLLVGSLFYFHSRRLRDPSFTFSAIVNTFLRTLVLGH